MYLPGASRLSIALPYCRYATQHDREGTFIAVATSNSDDQEEDQNAGARRNSALDQDSDGDESTRRIIPEDIENPSDSASFDSNSPEASSSRQSFDNLENFQIIQPILDLINKIPSTNKETKLALFRVNKQIYEEARQILQEILTRNLNINELMEHFPAGIDDSAWLRFLDFTFQARNIHVTIVLMPRDLRTTVGNRAYRHLGLALTAWWRSCQYHMTHTLKQKIDKPPRTRTRKQTLLNAPSSTRQMTVVMTVACQPAKDERDIFETARPVWTYAFKPGFMFKVRIAATRTCGFVAQMIGAVDEYRRMLGRATAGFERIGVGVRVVDVTGEKWF
ncbi:hypothetical protein EG327_003812 [Venturia inaequalis]|uniref:Uncharacterized protein n=1 Tax=Venturia inaequalis TaxID=5025 RepID=A0A8H3Z6R2_VENIN|nr:hypothetical protein EG327_003812 [Venturia inaequalis]